MIIRDYTFIVTVGYGLGSGLGWLLAIMSMAGIRQRLAHARIPRGLDGPGITLIIAGLMALAFIDSLGCWAEPCLCAAVRSDRQFVSAGWPWCWSSPTASSPTMANVP